MSLQDHVDKNRATGDARTEAETALLNAITKAVEEVEKEDSGLTFVVPRLKDLAEAYALVVHGNAVRSGTPAGNPKRSGRAAGF
ncbi:hypothetical protein [Streptomyces sp. NPDC057336]|uniref:hypothetical protein n=1 Tax=Streptomyces sp. NPDC057336 TaxID=3346102 RepID=UPI0036263B75